MIKAGAMDGFGYNRNELLSGFAQFIERSAGIREDREVGQTSLFDFGGEELSSNDKVVLAKLEPWSRGQSLAFEKETLGFYLTDHPLRGLETVGKVWGAGPVSNLVNVEAKSKSHVLGLISTMREIITKKGTRMAFARIEDMSGSVEVVIFPDTFAQYERVLKSDAPVVISGTVEKEEGNPKIIAEQVRASEDMFKQIKRITLEVNDSHKGKLALLREWAEKFPGDTALSLRLQMPDLQKSVELELKELRGVKPSGEALDLLLRLDIPLGFA